jgi:hypothetical protein
MNQKNYGHFRHGISKECTCVERSWILSSGRILEVRFEIIYLPESPAVMLIGEAF